MSRKYAIFDVSEINLIDFSKVCEDSVDTLRISIDGTKTFVHWKSIEIPDFIENFSTLEGIYSHQEMLNIIHTEDWTIAPIYTI